jgi:hypothetical protein
MKKLLFMIIMLITFISCNSDEIPSIKSSQNCNCGTVLGIEYLNNNQSTISVANDCTNKTVYYTVSNGTFKYGQKFCKNP